MKESTSSPHLTLTLTLTPKRSSFYISSFLIQFAYTKVCGKKLFLLLLFLFVFYNEMFVIFSTAYLELKMKNQLSRNELYGYHFQYSLFGNYEGKKKENKSQLSNETKSFCVYELIFYFRLTQ